MKSTNDFHITIVGGGITGLSAAWVLQEAAGGVEIDISYSLLEESDRWGGKIRTDTVHGFGETPFIVEGGPDSFLTQKPWAAQLAREIGLADQLLPTNDDRRQTFVLNKGRPTTLPDGLLLIVPTKIKPFAFSRLISPWGKLRMGLDWFIPAKTDDQDETLSDFIKRRLGQEALDKIAEPLLSGIYNADAEKQSMMATFPRFRQIEKEHGSLIKGMLAAQKARKQAAPAANGRKPSMFTSFKPGMEELVLALREKLNGDCRLRSAVVKIEAGPLPSGGYRLTLNDGTTLATDAVILAVPAFVAARLLADIAPEAAQSLAKIRYVSTGTVSLGYRRAEINHPLNGFGIVIPRSEKRRLNAITWSSTKFEHRAPAGHVLLRIFIGGSRTPEMMSLPDAELTPVIKAELADIMGIQAEPVFQRIYRWERSNPQYDVGHRERVAALKQHLPPGLVVTGSPYGGVGVPDCVRQARETAVETATLLAAKATVVLAGDNPLNHG